MKTFNKIFVNKKIPVTTTKSKRNNDVHRNSSTDNITENIKLAMRTWLFTCAFFTISCITNVTSTVVRTIGVDTRRVQMTIVAGRFRTFINV
jgi:hypothetical protein